MTTNTRQPLPVRNSHRQEQSSVVHEMENILKDWEIEEDAGEVTTLLKDYATGSPQRLL